MASNSFSSSIRCGDSSVSASENDDMFMNLIKEDDFNSKLDSVKNLQGVIDSYNLIGDKLYFSKSGPVHRCLHVITYINELVNYSPNDSVAVCTKKK